MKQVYVLPLVGLLLAAMPSGPASALTFEEQVAGYIRDYPRQRTYEFAAQFSRRDPARLNTWLIPGEPALIQAGDDVVPRTSNDTLYQVAIVWLDHPVVLSSAASSQDRFSSFQLQDDNNTNYRNIIFPEGEYTLYYGSRPERIRGEAIEAPSRLAVVFVRVEVKNKDDPDDVAAARAVLEGMTISGRQPDEFPTPEKPGEYAAEVVDEANRRMDDAFATIPFTHTIVGPGQQPGTDVAYLSHAAGTKAGFGGPDPSHSVYEAILFDKDGAVMTGRHGTYTVTTEEPLVEAFWSVTVYDTARGGFLHPNRHDRYHINDTLAVRNGDGTVTFTFKRFCETGEINCLEVPEGRFEVVTRYYLPGQEVITGAWTFPKIRLAGAPAG